MANYLIEQLRPRPGIQRDLTPYSAVYCTDGTWCRFFEGVPMKMLGYRTLDVGNNVLVRSMFNVPIPAGNQIYLGRDNSVVAITIDNEGNLIGFSNQTPAGLVPNPNTLWEFQSYSTTTVTTPPPSPITTLGKDYIVAIPTQKALDGQNSAERFVYATEKGSNLPFLPLDDGVGGQPKASGGIVSVSNILVAYGEHGQIQWTYPGQINNWTDNPTPNTGIPNFKTISNSQLIHAVPTAGASNPTLLFWSTDEVVRASFTEPDSPTTGGGRWSPQVLQSNSSLISKYSVVPYNQQIFWVGTTRFYMYNGVVQDLPNQINSQFFFDYLDYEYKSKIWGCIDPRYNEIWWFWPRKDAPDQPNGTVTECNWAIVYNTRENTWYDTPIKRASGIGPSSFQYPIWADSEVHGFSTGGGNIDIAPLWQHEFGRDEIFRLSGGDLVRPIKSSFTTNWMDVFSSQPNNNRSLRPCRIELDLIQVGDMTLTTYGRKYSRSNPIVGGPYTFTPNTPFLDDVFSQGRIVSFKFESSVLGGFYQLGKTNLDYKLGSVVP